jgi:RHS repeat-associated protein
LATALAFALSAAGVSVDTRYAAAAPAVTVDPPSFLPGEEVVSLRTRHSRTFVTKEGTYRRETALSPLNFRDASGQWQPIDSTLVPAPGGFVNKASDVRVHLPADLAAPVRVEREGASASFQLVGAAAPAEVKDRSASYRDALPGVDARYTAFADGVKEELILRDRSAQSEFRFLLLPGPGLVPRLRAGAVELVDVSGEPKLSFRPPFMTDSSERPSGLSYDVSLALEQVAGGFGLILRADQAWLDDPKRQFPVTIDPTLTTFGGGVYSDCTIKSGSHADENDCVLGSTYIGRDSEDFDYNIYYKMRALMKFDFASAPVIPANSQVLEGELELGINYKWPPSEWEPFTVDVHEHTHPYTQGVTWNKWDGSQNWPLGPGGQFVQTPAASAQVFVKFEYRYWYPTDLVQDWVSGMKPNDGLIVRTRNEASPPGSELIYVCSAENPAGCGDPGPQINVEYRQRLGIRPLYTFESQQLTDRLTAHANVGNGNLILEADDLNIAGTGLDLSIGRYFNNLQLFSRALGNGWSLSTGQDVFLTEHPDGSVVLTAPSFAPVRYRKKDDGSYSRPTAINGTLVKNGTSGWTLTFHADGSKWIFNASGQLTAEEDRNANRISYTYTSGRVTQITDTQGRNVTLTYNAQNLLETITDWTNRQTTYGYTNGYLTSVTDADNKVTTYGYDGAGNLTKICDPRGNRTLFAYDGSRRLTSLTRVTSAGVCADATGSGPTTSFDYTQTACTPDQSAGAAYCTIVSDPRGYPTTYHLDSELRAKNVTDALSMDRFLTYSGNSDLTTYKNHAGKIWTNTWSQDGNDNLEKSQLPDRADGQPGASSTWTYDPVHKYYPRTATDPQGKTTTFTYDSNGNVTEVLNAAGHTAKYAYNLPGKGTLKNSTDFKGTPNPDCPEPDPKPTVCYGYDAQGNLTSVNYPSPLGDVALTYDALSRVRSVTDGKGQTTTYTYDPLDRVTNIAYQDGSAIGYVYDGNGNVTSMTDDTGTTTYSYDKLNRLEQEVLPGPKTITYGYDASSNMTSMTDQGGTVTYAYNGVDRLTSLTAPLSGTTSFAYDTSKDHLRTEIRYPNGVTQYLRYDNASRLFEAEAKKVSAGTTLTKFAYSFQQGTTDRALRQSVTNLAGATTSYTYDDLNRLQQATNVGGQTYSYTYDPNSNRLTQTIGGQQTSYGHNAADQLISAGGMTFSYDLNGNEDWNSTGRDFAYNAKDQVTSVIPATGQPAIAMTYTGPGQFERVTRGSTNFTTGALGLGREQTGGATTDFTRDDDGLVLALRTGPAATDTYYPLFDGIGSVAGLANSVGTLVADYRYEPFGKRLSCTGAACSLPNPYQWLGGLGVYLDDATGLYKMGTRYYDPALGRFTQVDPVAGGSANRYDYAAQDPVNSVDPAGTICGPAGFLDSVIPDSFLGIASFRRPCRLHDKCYGRPGTVRLRCDQQLYAEMIAECYKELGLGWMFRRCAGVAKTYFTRTRGFVGRVIFEIAQGCPPYRWTFRCLRVRRRSK